MSLWNSIHEKITIPYPIKNQLPKQLKKHKMGSISMIDEIRPYSTKDLASIYGVCVKTFKKWITPFATEIGEKNGRYFSVAQVKIIFEKLDVPCKMKQ